MCTKITGAITFFGLKIESKYNKSENKGKKNKKKKGVKLQQQMQNSERTHLKSACRKLAEQ